MGKQLLPPPIKAKVCDVFDYPFEDNSGSTGYTYVLREMPDCVWLVGTTYTPPFDPIPGKPGMKRFFFKAAAPGEGILVFCKMRPWESPDTCEYTRKVGVIITE